mmetsp:Transcript_66162/g.183186  ORF Transcript_66162/g.183186 Transcript_66162/m.183186 type:complete len:301 (-) Transcript_66162:135-1037(-)
MLLPLSPKEGVLVPLTELVIRHVKSGGVLQAILSILAILGLRVADVAETDLVGTNDHRLDCRGHFLLRGLMAKAPKKSSDLVVLNCAIPIAVETLENPAHLDLDAHFAVQVPLLEGIKADLPIGRKPGNGPDCALQGLAVGFHAQLFEQRTEFRIVNVATAVLVEPVECLAEVARYLGHRSHASGVRHALVLDQQSDDARAEGRGLQKAGVGAWSVNASRNWLHFGAGVLGRDLRRRRPEGQADLWASGEPCRDQAVYPLVELHESAVSDILHQQYRRLPGVDPAGRGSLKEDRKCHECG